MSPTVPAAPTVPTVQQYRQALLALHDQGQITPNQMRLLQFHYLAPGHTATSRQLADQVGFAGYGGTNAQYGHLAHRLYDALDVEFPLQDDVWESILATWTRVPGVADDELLLIMRPEVAQALMDLGWVTVNQDWASLAQRWRAGEDVHALAHEAGMDWGQLYDTLVERGLLPRHR
jgi:hypothetical protein